jgi:hypothetical protein
MNIAVDSLHQNAPNHLQMNLGTTFFLNSPKVLPRSGQFRRLRRFKFRAKITLQDFASVQIQIRVSKVQLNRLHTLPWLRSCPCQIPHRSPVAAPCISRPRAPSSISRWRGIKPNFWLATQARLRGRGPHWSATRASPIFCEKYLPPKLLPKLKIRIPFLFLNMKSAYFSTYFILHFSKLKFNKIYIYPAQNFMYYPNMKLVLGFE